MNCTQKVVNDCIILANSMNGLSFASINLFVNWTRAAERVISIRQVQRTSTVSYQSIHFRTYLIEYNWEAKQKVLLTPKTISVVLFIH